MSSNKMKLTDDKTEAKIVSSQRRSMSLPTPDSLTVGTSNALFSQSVKMLGVTLDTHLAIKKNQVIDPVRTAKFELRPISSSRHYLSVEAIQKLVLAFVISRLDYCNSLLCGCLQYLIKRLHKVQNNAARLILKVLKFDHITAHLQTLHWLPVDARIQYKIRSLCFNAINSSRPQHLADLLKIYSPSRQLRSSADTCTLCIP